LREGGLKTNSPAEHEKAIVNNELVSNAVALQTVANRTQAPHEFRGGAIQAAKVLKIGKSYLEAEMHRGRATEDAAVHRKTALGDFAQTKEPKGAGNHLRNASTHLQNGPRSLSTRLDGRVYDASLSNCF
jgi:hypothetical protein